MGLLATFRHIRRLRDVEERLESAERAQKGLEMEWADTLEKINRQLGRIAKRQQFIEKHEAREPNERSEPLPMNGPFEGRMLTEHQREIQMQILRRRGGMG